MQHFTHHPIPVLIVEGQDLYRQGLRTIIEEAGLSILAEYPSAFAALEALGNDDLLDPDTVALCSLTLDRWQELAHFLLLRLPDMPILGLVDDLSDQIIIEALNNGVLSCMERTLPLEQWAQSIRQAHQGTLSLRSMVVAYPGVARYALMTLSQPPAPEGLKPLAPVLAHRERQALSIISEGVPLSIAGQQIGIPEHTLNDVLESACRKLVARQRLSSILQRVQ